MVVTPTQLRANLYRLLDHVLETGEALEIERAGERLRVVPARARSLQELFPPNPDLVVGDAGDLDAIDWS